MAGVKPACFFLLVLTLVYFLPVTVAQQFTPLPSSEVSLPYPIVHPNVTIDIGLIGFSNTTVRPDSLASMLHSTTSPYLQINPVAYGVNFRLRYNITFYSQAVNQSLRAFAQSSISVKQPPTYLQHTNTIPDQSQYAIISVNSLDQWLNTHTVELGLNESRYTILVANLTAISSLDHYYEASYPELDSSVASARYSWSAWTGYYYPVYNWLISWGGPARSYFIDLSAGSRNPSYDYTGRNPHFIPLQYFGTYQNSVSYGVTEYVAGYVREAVHEVIMQNYSVFPRFSQSYHIEIFLVDETGRMFPSNYDNFLNSSMVETALRPLIPYSNISVTVQFTPTITNGELRRALENSLISVSSMTGFDQTGLLVYNYDAQHLYAELRAHLDLFTGNSTGLAIPIFVFALKSAGRLVNTYQEPVWSQLPSSFDSGGATVFVYPELGLVSRSERQLFDWGLGLTHPAIQAAGEVLGLRDLGTNDGFTFGDAQASAVSRQTYAYEFSRFDEDSIQRAHADYLQSLDLEQLDRTQGLDLGGLNDLQGSALLKNATQTLGLGQQAYENLELETAVLRFNATYAFIDTLFFAHAESLKTTLDAIGDATALEVVYSTRAAQNDLANALTARAKGDLVLSFSLLSRASTETAVAATSNESYQYSRLSTLVLGLLFGLVIGAVLEIAVSRHLRRRHST